MGNRAHYDLGLAKEMQRAQGGRGDYLVLHLSELVRVAFMAATSEADALRMEGLKTMEVLFSATAFIFVFFTAQVGFLAMSARSIERRHNS